MMETNEANNQSIEDEVGDQSTKKNESTVPPTWEKIVIQKEPEQQEEKPKANPEEVSVLAQSLQEDFLVDKGFGDLAHSRHAVGVALRNLGKDINSGHSIEIEMLNNNLDLSRGSASESTATAIAEGINLKNPDLIKAVVKENSSTHHFGNNFSVVITFA